ncbi:thermonuclease family protein [Allorhizobium sp. BGMRC 0089]|uniref:thermonuclease family protein n=1 Tax=Allorhizobium sonneratiae TaxID=2934936 RepID=UPI002033ECA6|nr:thermonuclease family protein [Allorhizobium sonneratiae]MCM2294797.1 thermonuclease family protein [Allorhizobium sonneratiae]
MIPFRHIRRTLFIASCGLIALKAYHVSAQHEYAGNRHVYVSGRLCDPDCQPVTFKVWDGDTFTIVATGLKEKIRVYNIDAPEIDGKCQWEIDTAQRAKNRLADLIKGQTVTLKHHGMDLYHRTLANVLVDGRDIGDVLVSERLARAWDGARHPWCNT